MQVVASCDLRGSANSVAQTCTDVGDKRFVSTVQSICLGADSSGKLWHEGSACDRTGSLGGCKSPTAIMWYYPSSKDKTASDVKKECLSSDEYVRPDEEGAPQATASASAGAGSGSASTTSLASAPDLPKLLGTKADGWLPKPFTGLKKNMTPAQAAKVLPGADKLSGSSADILVKDERGVAKYRLRYVDRKLFAGEIWFLPALHNKAFHDTLVAAATQKWGPPRSSTDLSVIWFSETTQMATVSDNFDDGYKIDIQM